MTDTKGNRNEQEKTMSAYKQPVPAPQESQRQPSPQQQGTGQQNSPKKKAAEAYSATEQQRDKARLNLASNNYPRNGGDENTPSPEETPPQEVPQQDDRPVRYPAEDRSGLDARDHRRS